MRNRIVGVAISLVFIISLLTIPASAVMRASNQISGGWAIADSIGGGQISIEYQVEGTGKMSKLGANTITLYENSGSGWHQIKSTSGFTTTQAYSYSGTTYFSGVAGRQYYADVSVFATNSQGTDYRTYTTGVVTAY